MIRVLICDDSPEARSLLRTMLANDREIEVVGEASNGSEAIALALDLSPDVVLMDVFMPEVDGTEATERLKELLPSTRIVALTGADEVEVVEAMLAAGASAYCMKGAPLWELERAILGAEEPLVRLAHALPRAFPGGVGQLVARELVELTGALCVATYLSSADVGLSLAGCAGAPTRDRLSSAPGVAVRAFAEATAVTADAHELAELYRLGVPCGEALAVPLVGEGVCLGALLVAMPANVQVELDAEIVAATADLAAASLAQERRLSLTWAEARRDALTGLLNRRAFDEQLEGLLEREQVALVLLDVDHFKAVNDTDGHAAGDEVLTTVARVLLRAVRANDRVYRIGGDEFAVAIVGDDASAGELVGERILQAVRDQRRGLMLPSVSAGLAHADAGATTKEELFARADAALYAAKSAGRDRLVVSDEETPTRPPAPAVAPAPEPQILVPGPRPLRLLLVDDDPGLLMLLRTTFEIVDIQVEEARAAAEAEAQINAQAPDVIVLDVAMPGMDGLSFCRALKAHERTKGIPVIILSGAEQGEEAARSAGAEAFLRKPFSPLDLLGLVEELSGGLFEGPFRLMVDERPEEQLLLYARDLRRLLELERGQRHLVKTAYDETISAFAGALAAKDFGTGAHSQRVVRYAKELTRQVAPELLDDPSLEHGFLLHDVGKIGIPDSILQKPSKLTRDERIVMRSHTVLGSQLLSQVPLLQGEGLGVIRSHHERWDGSGYPDMIGGEDIPLGARIFAVADALDAITSDRPYRDAYPWETAVGEIYAGSRRQFDPKVVDAFGDIEGRLRQLREKLAA
ncbi:MAG TPA: response regulator [Gaiellaceae bacterium]|nr:response regulator [Gaiellaceae bacterium]